MEGRWPSDDLVPDFEAYSKVRLNKQISKPYRLLTLSHSWKSQLWFYGYEHQVSLHTVACHRALSMQLFSVWISKIWRRAPWRSLRSYYWRESFPIWQLMRDFYMANALLCCYLYADKHEYECTPLAWNHLACLVSRDFFEIQMFHCRSSWRNARRYRIKCSHALQLDLDLRRTSSQR